MVDPGDEHRDDEQDERLALLEDAEGARAATERNDRRFELAEALVLSLAAVLAAWAGFQSASWSGEQADAYNEAAAIRLEAVESSDLADQQRTVDVLLFAEWLDALQDEGTFDTPPGPGYQPDPASLSGFYFARLRGEMAPAVQAWLETDPFVDPASPPTPFVMDEYDLDAAAGAAELRAAADRESLAGQESGERSDRYVLMTILFATVLFFAGISSKLDTTRARGFLLGAAVVLLVGSIATILTFPVVT